MYILDELLNKVINIGGSDLHLTVGAPPMIRKNGSLVKIGICKLNTVIMEKFAGEILGDKFSECQRNGELDTSYSVDGIGRFRVNVFKQRGSYAIAIRVVPYTVPTIEELNHPAIMKELVKKKRGLILVTGPTGSGKSTTLAAMLNEINTSRDAHIITLEDPIEFLHKHNKSIINQREVGVDTESYKNALKSILREDPDVILIGEMRDIETVAVALTAAETGHLVLSTLHTIGAAKTIDRIIDVFPPYQQQQIKVQLATVLEGIISQQLLPKSDDCGRVAALEIMTITNGIKNMIREGKTYQIDSAIQTGGKFGMRSMDSSIVDLMRDGFITKETAFEYCVSKENIEKLIGMGYY